MTKVNGWKMDCVALMLCAAAVSGASAQTVTNLVSFDESNGTSLLYMALIQGANGNFCGRTRRGGANCLSDNETVLWNLDANNGNAGNPFANNLISDGVNFYGVTWEGGNTAGCLNGCGTVFELSPGGDGGWSETLLYAFQPSNGSDGSNPLGGLARDKWGNLFGATYFGGGSTACNNGCGTVFELIPSASGWTETVLYRFAGGADGNYPYSTLIIDGDGSLYGTTYGGGGTNNLGTVYKLSDKAGTWALTTLHTFMGNPDGSHPEGPVVYDKEGNLNGTTAQGGAYDYGSVYQLNSDGLKVLHSFKGFDGAYPAWVAVTVDRAGNLYGTTENGGANQTGSIWELLRTPTGYSEQLLYSFGTTSSGDGIYPWAGLTMRGDTLLLGTTSEGGTNNWGTVFALGKTTLSKWTRTTLYDFTGKGDGAQPGGSLLESGKGALYGIADGGGTYNTGVVFQIAH
ncbi:MAG TPA: choice-of-anchor tandem repeat GloVer-containing protein [Terriglobales bacterium]|jgi:uncharacterized repeat protein (TIGR03803 family)|nr:choice-of-anchor tandem repeat GloVer-containing protein [Terriglobales bacterium]